MYFGQLPKLCSTRIVKPRSSVDATTPLARLRRRVCNSMPSNPSAAPGCSAAGERVVARRLRADAQRGFVQRGHEARQTGQQRRLQSTAKVLRTDRDERQQRKELAVLQRHRGPERAPADLFHARGHAGACLCRALASVER